MIIEFEIMAFIEGFLFGVLIASGTWITILFIVDREVKKVKLKQEENALSGKPSPVQK